MRYRVLLTEKAEGDVDAILKWFSDQRASSAGRRWLLQLISRLATLEQHPERCSVAAESDIIGMEIRELLLGQSRHKYRLLFRIVGKAVQILRVWHASRDAIQRDDL